MSDAWLVYIALAAVFLLVCGLLAAASLRGRLGSSAAALFVLALAIWVLAAAAVASGFHDADGFVDCREDCTGVHYATAFGLLSPPLLVSVAATGMIVAIIGRRRARRRR
jgi:hypothetical protein